MQPLIDMFEGFRMVRDILCELFDVEKFLSRARGVQELINRGGTEGEKAAARTAMERMLSRAEEEKKELSPEQRVDFERRLKALLAGSSEAQNPNQNRYREPPRREPPPKKETSQKRHSAFKVGDWVKDNMSDDIGQIVSILTKPTVDFLTILWMTGKFRGMEFPVTHTGVSPYDVKKKSQTNDSDSNYSSEASMRVADFSEGTSNKRYGIVSIAMISTRSKKYYTFWGRRDGPYMSKELDSASELVNMFNTKIRKGYSEIHVDDRLKAEILSKIKY